MNAYVEKVIAGVKKKYSNEPEFVQTVEEVLSSLSPVVDKHPEYEKFDLLGRMVEPDRMFTFRVVWMDDNGNWQTNTGYRLWPYAKMNDPRIHWGQLYAVLDNDPTDSSAYKFGYANEDGWIAYFNHGQAFVKKFDYIRGAKYPDMGSSYQTYTSDWGVELETLSPLQFVKPGKTISQVETWYVVPSEGLPTYDDDEISKKLEPIAAAAGFRVPEPNNEPWDPTFEEED